MADTLEKPREPAPDRFDELRSLIVGPEQRELRTLAAHLLDPSVQVRDVSRVLPDAIALRSNDSQLTRVLAPTIEEALTASVRRDPRPLADALFPVMGPAIRKAIAHTLAAMMDSLNRTVEQSVSLRALQWRWTAFRTGRRFAEIVLLNTLQYRVEQVFLIHRETGLLLQHLSADAGAGQHADQISAMLTAIRDFVSDSFNTGGGESLDALRIGELSVMVEQGPRAVLACVVRGTPPADVHSTFEATLESIHLRFGPELEQFRGEAARFEAARPLLEACLLSQYRTPATGRSYRRWAIAGVVLLAIAAAWGVLRIRDARRFAAYLDRLRAEPGIVVVSAERDGGRFTVSGLRDPLAADPAALVAGTGLAADAIDARWQPYQAIDAAFITTRARDLLRPPTDVSLSYHDGVLTAAGPAPARWIVDSERLAPALAGVRRFAYAGTAPDIRVRQALESIALLFPRGDARLVPDQDAAIRAAGAALTELNDLMRARGARATIELLGHTDADGTELENVPLSRRRAETVRALLPVSRLDALDLEVKGVASAAPLTAGDTEDDKRRNRRVAFRVTLPDDDAQTGRVR
jgi:outer membrane protein OmpA-like peptidoglycan-associated protein